MPVYTKKGDRGETGLPGKRRLPKTDAIFEFLGALDQANAVIGVTLNFNKSRPQITKQLRLIQSDLLEIGSAVASENPQMTATSLDFAGKTSRFERQIDAWEANLPELKNFILPGGNTAAAMTHLARTAVRESERVFHHLSDAQKVPVFAQYLNRLSDYLFTLARAINYQSKTKETIWQTNRDNLS